MLNRKSNSLLFAFLSYCILLVNTAFAQEDEPGKSGKVAATYQHQRQRIFAVSV